MPRLIALSVLLLSLLLLLEQPWVTAQATPAAPQTINLLVPANGTSGNGTCSPFNVTEMSYTVTAASPGLQAVLACNQVAYNELLTADLTNNATAALAPPLIDLSCVQGGITTCSQQFPANRQLVSQVMCILLKYNPGNSTAAPLSATIQVTWTQATAATTSAATAHVVRSGVGAMSALVAVLLVALLVRLVFLTHSTETD